MSDTAELILHGNGGGIGLSYPFQIAENEGVGLIREKEEPQSEDIHMEQDNDFWNPYRETAEGYALSIPLPGRKGEEIKVEAHSGFLRVATHQIDGKEKSVSPGSEQFTKSFRQSFSMPDDVELNGLSALFKDGVLKILLPRMNGSFFRTVPVNEA